MGVSIYRQSPTGTPEQLSEEIAAGGLPQLGHSSSQVTPSVYAHLLDREEQVQRTREMLQEMLGSVV